MLINYRKRRLASFIVDLSNAEKLASIELPFCKDTSGAKSLELTLIVVHCHSYDICFVDILDSNALFSTFIAGSCLIVKQTRRSITGYLDSCSEAVNFY